MGLKLGQMYWDVSANTTDFDRGMQHVDRSASQTADSASGSFRRIAETAMGFLVAQAIPAVLNGFKSLVAGASESYGAYERLTLSLEQMAKRDVMDAATIEHRNVVGQRSIELTAKQIEQLEDLRLRRTTMAAQMQEESERHRQLVERYGEEGLAVITHSAKMAEMREKYGDVTGAIAALESQSGQLVDIVKRSTEVIMDENEAKAMASKISKELLDWQRKLTIESPFTEEGVQNAIKTVSAYGFMTDQAMKLSVETGKITQAQADQGVSLQRVIQAMTDYSAATGRTSREVELIALALGQVKAKGKLAGQEILQLTNAGVNVRKVLAEAFGVTTQELVKMQEQGLIPADKAIQAIVESFEKDFGGAAKAQTSTWQGLLSTLSDVKKIGLRELFTGTFQAIQPFIAGVVGKLADPATIDRIRAFGDAIGQKVGKALEFVKDVILSFKMGGVPGLLLALGIDIETVQTLQRIGDTLGTLFDRVSGYIAIIRDGFKLGGLAGGFSSVEQIIANVGGQLQTGIADLGNRVSEWWGGLWDRIKNWWRDGGGAELVTGTIEGFGAWVADVIRNIGQFNETARGGILEAIGKIWQGLVDWWQDGGAEIVLGTLTALGNALAEIGMALWEVGSNLAVEITEYTRDLWYGMVDWWQEGGQQLVTDTIAAIGLWFQDVWAQLQANLPGWIDQLDVWVTGLFNGIVDTIATNYPTWATKAGELLGAFLGKALDFLFNTLPQLIGKLAGWLAGLFSGGGESEATSWGPGNPLYDAAAKIGPAILEGVKGGLEAFWTALMANAPEQVLEAVEWIGTIIQGLIDTYKWLQGLEDQGKELIQGFITGVLLMDAKLRTSISTFVTDNVKKAVDWIKLLWQAGQDIVEGLKRGLKDAGGRFKQWVIDWLKSILPQPILDFLGIHSPSLLFAWIGQQIVAGLTQGLQNSTPEAIDAVSQMIQGVMGAVSSVLGAATGLANLQGVLDLQTKLDGVFEIIEQVLSRTRALASEYATPAGQELLQRLADFGSTMQSAFGVFQSALSAATQMVQVKVEPGDIASANAIFEFVKRMIPEVVELLSDIADQFTAEQLVQLGRVAELAALVQGALASWKAAADAVHDIAAYMIQRIGGGEGSQLWTLAQQMFGLIRKLATVVDMIGEEDLLAASVAGEKVAKALTPWKSAIDAINQIAEYTYMQIGGGPGQPLNDLANQVFGLLRKLARVVDWIGPETLALAADAGTKITAALSPWKAAIAAIAAIVTEYEYVQIGGGEESKLALLAQQLFGLVRKIATIAQQLGTSTITYAAEVAGLIVQALAPWKVAIDTAMAIAAYVPQGLDYQMEELGDFMAAGVQALSSIALSVGVDTLALAAKVGKQFRAALEPWELAIKVADQMRAFKFTGDLVEKFHRFARDWAAIIADLIDVVDDLNEEGLPLVEAFGRAIGAIAQGLGAALEVALGIPSQWALNKPVWDAFKTWVMDTFREFYDWLSTWSVDSEGNGIPAGDDELNLVAAFGAALSSLMGGLRSALDLAVNLPATWAVNLEVWNSFIAWVRSAFTTFYNWITTELVVAVVPEPGGEPGSSGDPTTSIGLVQAFGSALSSLMDGLRSALDLAVNLPATWAVNLEVWNSFIAWVRSAFTTFYNWITTELVVAVVPEPGGEPGSSGDPTTSIGLVQAFGSALSSLMGGLRSALDLAVNLPATWAVNPEVWNSFIAWVRSAFTTFYNWITTELVVAVTPEPGGEPGEPGDPTTSIGLVTAFGSALSSLMGGLASTLEFILGFPNAASYPTGEIWTAFRDWVMLVFQQFQTWVMETFHPEDPNAFGPVASFGQAMQAVFGGLVAALEFFRDIVGWVGAGSTFQERLATFLTEVKARFLEIATFVTNELDADVMASVSSFGDALGRLAGGLGDALALFHDLADTDPTVFTAEHDFRVRVQALMRSIHDVIDAFWTYIVDENGDLWIPVADDLFDKFDRMLRVMRDALNLFVDLQAGNLPTPNDLQTFIGLVIDLFVRLTGAILDAGTGSATGVGQIETNIQGGLLALGGYVDDFYTMGQNFANALADGIRSALGNVTAAGGELGEAAAGGTGDALQISSPSKVAMRLGGFFVEGFANSLLAGRQTIAGAMGSLFGSRDFAFDNVRIDSTRTIRVEFSGSAGGGVPLTSGQFDTLKSQLVWALQRGV